MMTQKHIIFTDDVKVELWEAYGLILIKFKSGDEWFELVMPKFVAEKLLNKENYLLDDTSDR